METIPAKTILSGYADTAWFGANYNMNLYKGCCHGCIYCDSRSSCYRVERFDTVRAKENALEILRRELLAKRRSGIVHTGAMSDPYNPFEKEACLTAGALDLLARHGFGAVLATKSDLAVRDAQRLLAVRRGTPRPPSTSPSPRRTTFSAAPSSGVSAPPAPGCPPCAP